MYEIVFKIEGGEDTVIFASHGENLLELARKANVAIDAPCSGNGSCGKCRVRLIEGEVYSAITRHINDYEYFNGWRLACVSKVSGNAKILVPDIAAAYKSRMRVSDLSSPLEIGIFESLQREMQDAGLEFGNGYSTFIVEFPQPTLQDTMPDNERITRAVAARTGKRDVHIRYSLLKKLPNLLRGNNFRLRCLLYGEGESVRILDMFPPDGVTPICGLAVDIGTTTVSALLVDLETGRILAKASTGNGQIRYGADVINRIVEQQKPGGVERLRYAAVHESLLPVIHRMCGDAAIDSGRIGCVALAGNTTMNHLMLGVDANYLRMDPYVPAFFEIAPIFTREVGIDLAPGAKMIVAPNIGSYVGGDITAGTLASMIWNSPELSLLVDLGTNGEIVFGNSEFLMACACSAGPAFEGGDIRCGMRATDGAIEECRIDAVSMDPYLTVIGGGKPVGLCGSGIIDVMANMFRAGIINGRGKFVRDGERVARDEFGTGRYILAFDCETATGREIYIN
ncbi:MAG: ASKHA domain-containing protein, partial [Oscillospiraceae bacterium]|nr:ASKHA domain-containing protein [Oscillospiraceae bacterium]